MRPVESQWKFHKEINILFSQHFLELKVQLNFKNTRDTREILAAVLPLLVFLKIPGCNLLLNDTTFLLKASNDSYYQEQSIISFDANVSSFSLAESPPHDLQITAYK